MTDFRLWIATSRPPLCARVVDGFLPALEFLASLVLLAAAFLTSTFFRTEASEGDMSNADMTRLEASSCSKRFMAQ